MRNTIRSILYINALSDPLPVNSLIALLSREVLLTNQILEKMNIDT